LNTGQKKATERVLENASKKEAKWHKIRERLGKKRKKKEEGVGGAHNPLGLRPKA